MFDVTSIGTERNQEQVSQLDELFLKTKALPVIYYKPHSQEYVDSLKKKLKI